MTHCRTTPLFEHVCPVSVKAVLFSFVLLVVLRPSQQLWSCRDGQFT